MSQSSSNAVGVSSGASRQAFHNIETTGGAGDTLFAEDMSPSFDDLENTPTKDSSHSITMDQRVTMNQDVLRAHDLSVTSTTQSFIDIADDNSSGPGTRQTNPGILSTPTKQMARPAVISPRNPFLYAEHARSSPLSPNPSKAHGAIEGMSRPSSSATEASSTSTQDAFWLGVQSEGRTFIHSVQSTDSRVFKAEIVRIETEYAALKGQLARSLTEASANQKHSAVLGWGTLVGMTALGSVMLSRYCLKMNTFVTSTLATGAILGTTAAACYAVCAADDEKDSKVAIAVLQQLMSPLETRLSELQNTVAVLQFYSTLDDGEITAYVSGRHFAAKTRLFENKFTLSASDKDEVEFVRLNLARLRPLPTGAMTSLAVEIAALTVYYSNSIECVGLGLSETQVIIRGLFCPAGEQPMHKFVETWTHAKALARVIDLIRSGLTRRNLRPTHMREIHQLLMADDPAACPGTWRKEAAYISSEAEKVFASPLEIDPLVESVFEYLNTSNDHEIEVAINVHAWLLRVHPFADGNGRVIRLLIAFVAMSGGYTGIAFTCGADQYFKAIRAWDRDTTIFGSLFVRELNKMAEVYKKAAKAVARPLA